MCVSRLPLGSSAITTLGYAGILVGPAFIGFLADATTLSFALLTIATLMARVDRSIDVRISRTVPSIPYRRVHYGRDE